MFIIIKGDKSNADKKWVNKQNVLDPYNGILFSHIQEWSIDTSFNLDKLQKSFTKWKVPNIKPHFILFYLY